MDNTFNKLILSGSVKNLPVSLSSICNILCDSN